MMYDVVLTERPHDCGLSKSEIMDLIDMTIGDVIPLDIVGDYSSAMGFITLDAADALNYDFDKMNEYVKNIINDMENESEDCTYKFDILTIWLSR